jgi:hypothetical protein
MFARVGTKVSEVPRKYLVVLLKREKIRLDKGKQISDFFL